MRSSLHSRRRRPLDAARAKPPRRPRQAARVLRVLVAEDNPTNQKLVSALLDQHGHHVSIVNNGRLAVERAAQEPFDIILMDVQMPEMSGLEATAAIREAERDTGRHIPIVALTARAMAGDREQCLAAGMDAYVSKPVRADELFSTMEAMTGAQPPVARQRRPARQRRAASPEQHRVATVPEQASVGSVDLSALMAGFGGRADLVKRRHRCVRRRRAGHADPPRTRRRGRPTPRSWPRPLTAIKGSAGLFSQGEAYTHATALELRARGGDVTAADRACAGARAERVESDGGAPRRPRYAVMRSP